MMVNLIFSHHLELVEARHCRAPTNIYYYRINPYIASRSSTKVTGPSFSIDTCIIAPN